MNESQAVLAKSVSERELSQWCVDLARLCGWKVARWPTWRATGTDAGVPDLLLCREDREPMFVELKAERGRLSPAQSEWMHAIHPHGLWKLWRPSDWYSGKVEELLRGVDTRARP